MKNDFYKALKNPAIREGIAKGRRNSLERADRILRDYPFLIDYANDVRLAKLEIILNYEYWVDRSIKTLKKFNKNNVYLAHDYKEALEIIGEIVKDDGIILKSKSMVAEEINLRDFLIKMGKEVWETDLGELIIQLAEDKPMHLIAPAIHYSERDVRKLLRKIGIKDRTIEGVVRGVRNFLREKFLKADVGITGCNAFSATTGRIFLVENEGNIRLLTSLSKKRVSVVSIDKILTNDELCLKSILVQSAFVGTFPPSYINIEQPSDSSYIIFLDNGRSHASDFLKEQLLCIRCGRCQLECPVFQILGSYWGDIYGGPMGMALNYIISKRVSNDVFLCSLCGKCKEVCPMRIDMPKMIWELKRIAMRN